MATDTDATITAIYAKVNELDRKIEQFNWQFSRSDEHTQQHQQHTSKQLGVTVSQLSWASLGSDLVQAGALVAAVLIVDVYALVVDTLPPWLKKLHSDIWHNQPEQVQADFESAFQVAVGHEGGYSHHPADSGKATYKGITQAFLDANRRAVGVRAQSVTELSDNDVKALYQLVWKRAKCQKLEPPLDQVCLDTAINFGVGGWQEFKADVGELPTAKATALAVVEARKQYRHQRVAEAPSQEVFLQGWLNRDTHLEKIVAGYPASVVPSSKIAKAALFWVGKEFQPGVQAQCMVFVRQVLTEVGVETAVTKDPIDGITEPMNPAMANSIGTDQGEFIKRKQQLEPGDIVFFGGTYGGYAQDDITHVGIYVGNGEMVDRPTASAPVKRRSIDTFPHFMGAIRLNTR
ncbi:MAG: hypothetical protein F6K19_37480 [Cyanothece sp. SIO1E1]|nr:hypothetical protein [Cyanothece sp. SIO1E1]